MAIENHCIQKMMKISFLQRLHTTDECTFTAGTHSALLRHSKDIEGVLNTKAYFLVQLLPFVLHQFVFPSASSLRILFVRRVSPAVSASFYPRVQGKFELERNWQEEQE